MMPKHKLIATGALWFLITSCTSTVVEMEVTDVMRIFGAKGENAFTSHEITGMNRSFDRMDSNRDGYLNEEEYVGLHALPEQP